MHPPGYLFALVHPVIDGLQYILLDALTGVSCGLPNLLAYILAGPYHNIVPALLILSNRRLLGWCAGSHAITSEIMIP